MTTNQSTRWLGILAAAGLAVSCCNHAPAGETTNRSAATATAPKSDPVIARGKGFEIKRSRLDEMWAAYEAKVKRGGQMPDEPRADVETRMLDHLIGTEIMLLRATDGERAQARQQTDQMLAGARRRFDTEDDFKAEIKALGLAMDQYQARLLEQNLCNLVIDRELKSKISISDEAVKKYYDNNAPAFEKPDMARGRQIFLSVIDPATEQPLPADKQKEKEKLARDIKARLDQGEGFFKLLKQYSEDAFAKDEVESDEPLYARGQMPPEFDAVAFSIPTNQVSDVVRSSAGFHLIRISRREPASKVTLAEATPKLREFLASQEAKQRLPDYVAALKKEAAVEIVAPAKTTAPSPETNATPASAPAAK